jgi:hypothetical protein
MGQGVEPDDEGWTEAYDGEVERSDMVGKAANGTAFLLMKSAQNAAAGGLFAAEDVHKLMDEADSAELAKATYEALVKEKYSAEDRRRMAGNGQAMDDGSYPIADAEDVRNAVHAVGRGGASHDAIRRHVIARARALGQSSQIPDSWASDGSLETPAVAKADGEPGSPAWEAQDAAQAQDAIKQLGALRALVQQLVAREGAEVGAGHLDDLDDALDLKCIDDALCFAMDGLTAFAVGERAAAAIAKAAAKGGASAVHDTITKLAGACGCPVCAGWIAGAKQQGDLTEAAQPPEDANDGPAADQQAPHPAPPKPTPAATPAVATPEQTMTKTADTESTATTSARTDDQAAALKKAQSKAEKKAKRAAVEAALLKATERNTELEGQVSDLLKRVERVESAPAQGSGPVFNGAAVGATPQPAPGITPGAVVDERAALTKAIAEESDPVRKAELQERFVVGGLKAVFAAGPTVAPAPRPQG